MTERDLHSYPYMTHEEESNRLKRGFLIGAVVGLAIGEVVSLVAGAPVVPHVVIDAVFGIAGSSAGATVNHMIGVTSGQQAAEAAPQQLPPYKPSGYF